MQGAVVKKQRVGGEPIVPTTAGAPALLDLVVVDAVFQPFLDWLALPASTLFSQKVKRSLLTADGVSRMRSDLRNLARVCYEACPGAFVTGFYLGGLVSKQVVDAMHAFHCNGRQRAGQTETTGVGQDVRYKLNLL